MYNTNLNNRNQTNIHNQNQIIFFNNFLTYNLQFYFSILHSLDRQNSKCCIEQMIKK